MEPMLTYSDITGRVYIVTKYKRLDGGVIDAREKFDVTEWVESYARKLNAQTVEENTKMRELVKEALASHEKMCTQRGNCFGCQFFDTELSRVCPIVTVNRSARELGIEANE